MEHKSIPFELKDMSKEKRTAVIAHAVYNNIDRVGDISTKGMFNKSWKENKSIDFLFNHNEDEIPGVVLKTFEDDEKAYTEVKFGAWKLGDDILEMADAGVLRGASFGFDAEKKEYTIIKGKRIRKLKEVKHIETSLLTKMPANPLAGIIKLNKSFEVKYLTNSEQTSMKKMMECDQACMEELITLAGTLDPKSDLYVWVMWQLSRRADVMAGMRDQMKYNVQELTSMKAYVQTLEKFCRNSNASDETIKALEQEIQENKSIISVHDTADTRKINEPTASAKEISDAINLLTLKHFV